jgi:hypothetical protein
LEEKQEKLSEKMRQLKTGLQVKHKKLSEVETTSDRFGGKQEKLSEVETTSDRFGGKAGKAVRR